MTTPIAAATIAQQAFRYIGASTPSSFADDSEETRAATEQFPAAIRECLELRDWRFASSLLRLAKATPTAPEWTADADLPHAYRLPDGVLVARAIQPRGARWRRDGDYLRCDQDEGVTLRATMLRTDEKNLPAAFRDLVALTLALQLAPRFARDAARIAMIGEQRETALASAIASDQGQATPGPWLGADLASSQIVQQAFRYVIGSEAGRFGDDAEEARAASQLYPQALDQCLAEEDWPFASATRALTEDADPAATVTGWRDDPSLPHAYALPDDALTPRAVRPRGTRWRREGPFIRADRASAIDLRFTRRFTAAAEDELPAAVRDYVALTLAKLLAPRFAASAEVAQLLAEKLAEARAYAIKTEAPQRSAGPFLSETLEGSEIAQQAWAHIEAGEDARPDDDGEKVRATDRLYRRAVRACLGAADWSFASKLRSLTEIADPAAADPDWTADEDLPHAYAIPAGALTIREVRPDGVAWRRAGPHILADEPEALVVRFTMAPVGAGAVADDAATAAAEADWPAEFIAWAALALARDLAPRFAGEKLAQQLMARADIAKRAALRVDRDQASAQDWADHGAGDWVAQVLR